MRADLYTIAAEDTAIKRERVALQRALSHHQRAGRTHLHAGPAGHTVRIMQTHIKWRRNNCIKALAKHPVAIGADHIVAHAHTLRAVNALIRIAQNKTMRQIKIIIMIIARLPIMEAIIGQAMLNAILLQIALAGSRAGTLQAASRFSHRLLPQIALLNQAEIAAALLVGQHRHLHLRLNRLVGHNIKQIRLALLKLQTAGYLRHILAAQECINRTRTKLALSHALNNRLRAKLSITTSKHPIAIRHKIIGIGLNRCPLRPLHPRLLIQHGLIRLLTIGRNNHIARNHMLRPRNWHRAAAATGIRFPQLIPDKLQALDFSILNNYPRRLLIIEKLSALRLRVLNLLSSCRYLLTRATIGCMNLRAKAARRARTVKCRKAAAQHHHLIALP